MLQKTYYKTKDYCKVKFSFKPELAETVEILGLNSDWKNSVIMSKKKDGSFNAEVNLPKDSKHEFKYRIDSKNWANDPEADGVRIVAPKESRFIVIAGRPLNEPIAQYGPFVMNTQAEIIQAMEDYRAGRFGA